MAPAGRRFRSGIPFNFARDCVEKSFVTTSFRIFGPLLACFSFAGIGWAADGVIYQAAYRLRMSDKEEVRYRDFFTTIGGRQGLAVGDVVEVVRAVPAMNALWGGPSPLIEVVLGEARVLAISPTGSIVRTTQLAPPEQTPVLQYRNFMIGDAVRTKVSFANAISPSLE